MDSVIFRGDSISALQWMSKGKTRSNLATRANAVLALTAHIHNVMVCGIEHVPGINNGICDRLSRPNTHNDDNSVVSIFGNSLPDLMLLDGQTSAIINTLLDLCNPMENVDDTDDNFEMFWKSAARCVRSITPQLH